jgi:hypothetical protein
MISSGLSVTCGQTDPRTRVLPGRLGGRGARAGRLRPDARRPDSVSDPIRVARSGVRAVCGLCGFLFRPTLSTGGGPHVASSESRRLGEAAAAFPARRLAHGTARHADRRTKRRREVPARACCTGLRRLRSRIACFGRRRASKPTCVGSSSVCAVGKWRRSSLNRTACRRAASEGTLPFAGFR